MTSNDFFEQIHTQFKKELPFVVYRKPYEYELKCLFQEDSLLHIVSDFTESGFIFAPFDNRNASVLIPIASSELLKCDDFYKNYKSEEKDNGENHQKKSTALESSRKSHIHLVEKAVDAIQNGDYLKVVLSRKEEVSVVETDVIEIFKKLLVKYESAFAYCWYHPKVGLWLGASPETLLKIQGNRLSTMALAGTQEFKGMLDVVWQKKEKEEQQIVTDFIVESLKSSARNIEVSETKTLKAGSLLHLKTDIEADFNPGSLNLKQIIQNLHPTPAICGLPKEEAKQFLLMNEGYDRKYYSGFLGELHFKEKTSRNSNRRNVENNAYSAIKVVSNLYVNLRCMQLEDDTAIIYVGGGITKDSIPEKEWQETVSKSEVIKSIL